MFRKISIVALFTLVMAALVPIVSHRASAQDGTITLNGTVNVVQADISASNGVIHIIDGVLVPPASVASAATAVATIASIRGGGRGEGGGGDEGGGDRGGGDRGGGGDDGGRLAGTPSPSVVDIISANPDLSTFASAIQ